jgi:NitT/TauT family transport system ATP-binding protein
MLGIRGETLAGDEGATNERPKPSNAVSISDVTYRYPGSDANVLEDVSIALRDGEFLSIVGPSGCGKTTLLDCVAGFLRPRSGEIRVRGERVEDVVPGRAGFMFARDTLLPWRSAIGNVEIAIRLREKRQQGPVRKTPKDMEEEAQDLLARVGLRGFESYMIDELSQGMRQRVALARTLAIDVPLILMDEPFGALDAQTRVVMQNEFLSVWEKQRRSVMLITHDVAEAIVMSDRIIVLGGRPAGVIADISVGLPRPRDAVSIHGEGGELFREIWHKLETASSHGSPNAHGA